MSDALRVVTTRAQDKNLEVRSKIASGICLQADRRALKQIALNLLSNAVKFTPENGRITVRGRVSRGAVVIGIQDSGIGIARDALQKLGRPFEQVESQLTKTHHGSGLGLAIAKSLIELHGGEMRIRSTLGAGTTVVVRLPLDGRPAEKGNAKQRNASGTDLVRCRRIGARVASGRRSIPAMLSLAARSPAIRARWLGCGWGCRRNKVRP